MNSNQPAEGTTTAPPNAHRRQVQGVFDAASPHYDRMNDLMTLGLHRPLKQMMIDMATLRPHHRVLDLAAGTGDLGALARPRLQEGMLVSLDANISMIHRGRDRLLDKGIADVPWVCALAEHLPFCDNAFDRVLIGFGLRNFSDKPAALAQIARCLRSGGRLLVLEMSQPTSARVRSLYDAVSARCLPWLGAQVAGAAAPYRYLHDSIRRHPSPPQIARMMQQAGLADTGSWRLMGGIFCLHWAEKP